MEAECGAYLLETGGPWLITEMRRLVAGDPRISARTPVSVEIDWDRGVVALGANQPSPVEVEWRGGTESLTPDSGCRKYEIPGLRRPGFTATMVSSVGRKAPAVSASEMSLPVSWEAPLGETPAVLKAAAPGLVCGGESGRLLALSPDGQEEWRADVQARINDAAYLHGEDWGDLWIVADEERMVRAFDRSGRERRSYRCPNGELATVGRARRLVCADLDGDGAEEILVGTAAWWVVCLDAAGEERWRTRCYAHSCLGLDTGDVNGDGRLEIVQSNEYYFLHVLAAATGLVQALDIGSLLPDGTC